jgi:hypothetical protein
MSAATAPIDAIHAHCFWCVEASGRAGRKLTEDCPIVWCALYEHRPRARSAEGDRQARLAAERRSRNATEISS